MEDVVGEDGGLRPLLSIEEIHEATGIDPWFLCQLREMVEQEVWYRGLDEVGPDDLRFMKRNGFSDEQLAVFGDEDAADVRARRWQLESHRSGTRAQA